MTKHVPKQDPNNSGRYKPYSYGFFLLLLLLYALLEVFPNTFSGFWCSMTDPPVTMMIPQTIKTILAERRAVLKHS